MGTHHDYHWILKLPSARPPRRCTDCGAPQQLIHTTIDYWESGLSNVQLVDAPVWECGNGHQEAEIQNAEQLHGLLVNLLIRKRSVLAGSEVRFLRKELAMSGKVFAQQLGMTAEHLSRLETGRREITSTTDLLMRLVVGWELTRRHQIKFPADVQPFVARPDAGQDVRNHRVQHRNDAPSDQQWVSASM